MNRVSPTSETRLVSPQPSGGERSPLPGSPPPGSPPPGSPPPTSPPPPAAGREGPFSPDAGDRLISSRQSGEIVPQAPTHEDARVLQNQGEEEHSNVIGDENNDNVQLLRQTSVDGSMHTESDDVPLPVPDDDDDDINNAQHKDKSNKDYERVYTPALPKADMIEETDYRSPTPTEAHPYKPHVYPRSLSPLKTPRDEDKDSTVEKTALPPIGANRVYPMDDGASHSVYSVVKKATSSHRAKSSHLAQRTASKTSLVIGADENTDGPGCCGWLLYIFSILLITITLPFSLMFTIKVVQEYERAVIFRLGRLPSGGAKGPGIFFIMPCIESYTKVDLRTVSFDVPPQEVLTKDSVTVSVDAVVYYRVSNPTVSVANVENAHHSTRLLAQTTLRNILGTKDMAEILSDRESISHGMQSTLDSATDRWGIKVERVEIKDVRLPVQLQRAMAAEAEAAREARAKVIAAEGEQKASRALREAADVMGGSSAALQLRYLQTLNSISGEKNSTIIFPLPIDMVQSFMRK